MSLKITLITPPDIYENENEGILLMNLPETAQTEASDWLGKLDSEKSINVYYYQGEPETFWLLHAMNVTKYKYIDIDAMSGVSSWLAGYILCKNNVFYSAKDLNIASIYQHINPNRVNSVLDFLERILGAEK
jgi:hypothetical protein